MSLLNLPLSNCSFAVDFDCLEEDEMWFVEQIMRRSGTMNETRQCIDDFNRQLDVTIRMKQRIAERDSSGRADDSEDDNAGDVDADYEAVIPNGADPNEFANDEVVADNVPDEVMCEAVAGEIGNEDDDNVEDEPLADVVIDVAVSEVATTESVEDKVCEDDAETAKATTAVALTESGVMVDKDVVDNEDLDQVDDAHDGNEYVVGDEFERFFQDAGWFKGEVVAVLDKYQVRVVFEEGKKVNTKLLYQLMSYADFERSPRWGKLGFSLFASFVEM